MKTTIALVLTLGIASMAPAFATPIVGTIGSSNNFSVIHDGSNPGGAGERDDWRWFDAGQRINMILENGILSLNGEQTFSLNVPSSPQESALVTFTEMSFDLNDANDGFAGGYLDYTLNGTDGTFSFADQNYGQSVFNSSGYPNAGFSVFVWGGDVQNALGMDMSITVPEPGVIALFLLGLGAVFVLRRRTTGANIAAA